MSGDARQTSTLRPSAVAVHDDRNMSWRRSFGRAGDGLVAAVGDQLTLRGLWSLRYRRPINFTIQSLLMFATKKPLRLPETCSRFCEASCLSSVRSYTRSWVMSFVRRGLFQ